MAAIILLSPSGLIMRFGLLAFAGAAGLDRPRAFAHLSRCASRIRLSAAGENFRRFRGGLDAAAG